MSLIYTIPPPPSSLGSWGLAVRDQLAIQAGPTVRLGEFSAGANKDPDAANALIKRLADGGGGAVLLDPGTFVWSSAITMRTGVALIGSGIGRTALDMSGCGATTNALIQVAGSGVRVRGLSLIGNVDTHGANGSYGRGIEISTALHESGALTDIEDVVLDQLELDRIMSIGVHVRSPDSTVSQPRRVWVSRYYAHDFGTKDATNPADHIGEGLQVTGGEDVHVTDFLIERTGNTGCDVEQHNVNQRTRRVYFTNGQARDIGNVGFLYLPEAAADLDAMTEIHWRNCHVNGVKSTKTADINGSGWYVTRPHRSDAIGCTVTEPTGPGFQLHDDDDGHFRGAELEVRNPGQGGSNAWRVGYALIAGSNSRIHGKAVDDQGSPTMQYGVYVQAAATDKAVIDIEVDGYVIAPMFQAGNGQIVRVLDRSTAKLDANSGEPFNNIFVDRLVQFAEISDPPVAPADSVRIYARDDGGGKTQIVARFNTGAIQVIATEP